MKERMFQIYTPLQAATELVKAGVRKIEFKGVSVYADDVIQPYLVESEELMAIMGTKPAVAAVAAVVTADAPAPQKRKRRTRAEVAAAKAAIAPIPEPIPEPEPEPTPEPEPEPEPTPEPESQKKVEKVDAEVKAKRKRRTKEEILAELEAREVEAKKEIDAEPEDENVDDDLMDVMDEPVNQIKNPKPKKVAEPEDDYDDEPTTPTNKIVLEPDEELGEDWF